MAGILRSKRSEAIQNSQDRILVTNNLVKFLDSAKVKILVSQSGPRVYEAFGNFLSNLKVGYIAVVPSHEINTPQYNFKNIEFFCNVTFHGDHFEIIPVRLKNGEELNLPVVIFNSGGNFYTKIKEGKLVSAEENQLIKELLTGVNPILNYRGQESLEEE